MAANKFRFLWGLGVVVGEVSIVLGGEWGLLLFVGICLLVSQECPKESWLATYSKKLCH